MEVRVNLTGTTIQVRSDYGSAVPGALVEIYDSSGSPRYSLGTTDAAGDKLFWLPDGDYKAKASKNGVVGWTTFTVGSGNPTAVTASEPGYRIACWGRASYEGQEQQVSGP
jgi:hypothetical protein